MEDDGDDKDDSKRRTRNLSEKKRRDQFNMLVTELSTLITTNNRKMDKSTVLKSTISFLKNHNEVTVRSRAHDVQEDWKPAFLSNEEFTYLVLEALEGFVMVFSVCGRIYYVSESITSLLGHNPVDIMNRNIFDLTFEEDRPNLYDMLHRNAIAAEQMPNTSKESEMITFQLHLRRGTLDFREEASYDLVQFYGHFRPNQDQVDEDGDRMVYQQDHDSRMLFICIGRLHTPQLIRDVSLVDSSRNEFTSRHSLEWKFLFLDHRAPPIIGYLPFEVLGTSGYDYYHFDDLEKVVTCHEALMQKGELTSCYYRFLTKGQQWIWLQTRFYITYHQWNSKPEFVVCTHRVVSYADVVTTTKEEGVEDADVSETEANQNSIKELPNDGDEPMPPMSPSYVSEASDAYGNYQPISQSTLVGLPNIQYLNPEILANFAKYTFSQSETPQVRLLPDTKVKFPSPIEQSESKLLQTSLSDTYIQETSQLSAATAPKNSLTEEVHQTNATLSQSVSVQKAISQSNTLQAMSNSHKDAILQSNAGNQAIPQSNMLAMSQFDAEVQEIMQSNAAISNIQPISKSNPEAQAISNIPTVLITKPPMTSFSRIFLASESPSYPMEMVTDDFGNSFQQASQNMLATPSPMPQSLSPSHESEHSDSHFNFYQTISQPASVKSASAGSTAGTINTAATTGASWPQTRYAAGSDAGSLSGESRSSQRNSERESHKTTETSLTPQHGIGAQYLDPAAYGSVVPAGMMPVSPVLVTSDHAQIQAQLQRKHEELQQMIVRQQEELRQVKEQLLLARLGLLQPLINVSNPYSTPEEIQNQQRMSAQLAYTNSPPRAIGYPQHVPLPMSALAVHPPHPQPQHPQPPHPQPQHPQPQHPQPPHPQPQHPHHPQHPTQPPHSSHPPQPPHPPHSSEPHQHMPQ